MNLPLHMNKIWDKSASKQNIILGIQLGDSKMECIQDSLNGREEPKSRQLASTE